MTGSFFLPAERVFTFYVRMKCFLISEVLKYFYTVDCEWNEWNNWSVCSKTCNTGSRTRSRTKTDALHGGSECSGDKDENQSCNTDECPGMCKYSTYGSFLINMI